MSNDAVALSPEEFVEEAGQRGRRLSSHLDRLDAGDVDLFDDVANLTRTLLGRDRGNDVIRRLCRQQHLSFPEIEVGSAPADKRDVVMSIGNIPIDPAQYGEAVRHAVELQDWLESPAIVLKGAQRRVAKWHQLVTDRGNTSGAHLSQTVPRVLAESRLYKTPGGSFETYLIRTAAVVAERALRELLPKAGYTGELPKNRPMSGTGANFAWLNVDSPVSDDVHFVCDFFIGVEGRHQLLSVPLHDRRMNVDVSTIPGEPGMSVRMVPDKGA